MEFGLKCMHKTKKNGQSPLIYLIASHCYSPESPEPQQWCWALSSEQIHSLFPNDPRSAACSVFTALQSSGGFERKAPKY